MNAALPTLFVSHGSPMLAVESSATADALLQWATALQAQATGLRAIVVMSPHWMTRGVRVQTHPAPPTWHDFGGFPPALYQLQYPAPGDPGLADDVMQALAQAGVPSQADAQQPRDHGAWVPLMCMIPQADLPAIQVSLPVNVGPTEVYAMGRALQGLRDKGVLVIGSGSMTHNLAEFFGGAAGPAPYVTEFCRWVEAAVQRQDVTALLDYRVQAPHAQRAHPTDEHFLPLFFALGAAGWGAGGSGTVDYLSREVQHGMLAMDALAIHAPSVNSL